VLARSYVGAPIPTSPTPGSPPANNSTGVSSHPTGPSGANGSSGSPGGIRFPPWIGFVAVAVIALVVVAVVLPGVRSVLAGRGPPPDDGESARAAARAARRALAGAVDALGEGRDPRAVIIALYGELLGRIVPMVGSVDPETPEEIRALHLVRLGISPMASESLTRLFEEARYSTHPLGPDAADRATEVIRRAEADLARAAVPA